MSSTDASRIVGVQDNNARVTAVVDGNGQLDVNPPRYEQQSNVDRPTSSEDAKCSTFVHNATLQSRLDRDENTALQTLNIESGQLMDDTTLAATA